MRLVTSQKMHNERVSVQHTPGARSSIGREERMIQLEAGGKRMPESTHTVDPQAFWETQPRRKCSLRPQLHVHLLVAKKINGYRWNYHSGLL